MSTRDSERVLITIEDGIAIVTLNRPDKYNGLDMPMFEAITRAAKTLKKDRSVRAIILNGAGDAFCSGLDVKTVSKNPVNFLKLLVKPGRRISNLAQNVGYLWRDVPAPVIAVTHGYCFGGGFQIALGADFRFSTSDCEFSIMESKWGLIPDMSLTVTLRELVPIDLAKELTMTARRFDGTEAKAMGLVSRVSDDPMAEAMNFARELAERSPDAVAASKLLFNRSWNATDRTALDWETKLQKKVLGRANQRIAVARNSGSPDKPYQDRRDF
ncbi:MULTISPECIES: crotonase/enoyl-CoA hydratase family protein [Marinobacter]|jgi:enoyl-CoA hydratase/carnithine racemase|uniref:crotonase/enoyl-CoA hydratase family protein n=1 Tax=Marinobacter TaxID=2742 RepID=UPI0009491AAA|nr:MULTISPECIES: crotonase/enoyl-CoA hydratase family protein [Marinobacter]MBJ7299142.1 crotonase/enoyl-CoA hydratase family protein [Marinobacter salarius]MCC4282993.1 crotonase/enoyl-CoA hydratase family protein [Marinobacter salarius]MCZ4283221.1 crotonase/enoyl-CoA hydratase family protein [Marinobacter salarius]MDC8456318.1 crotonase/enoyl-CoA hydratase family protein [Marinobacter sp. DS40M6]MDM8179715.1 crotonase/enoyl-CoA hydratase family protein [Marinobacter salarius]|tara:strand:+ start:2301 stop:3113 length:813 start_codon:yes stop_codon:yes gene_type:complete